jgi:hypothetical protein
MRYYNEYYFGDIFVSRNKNIKHRWKLQLVDHFSLANLGQKAHLMFLLREDNKYTLQIPKIYLTKRFVRIERGVWEKGEYPPKNYYNLETGGIFSSGWNYWDGELKGRMLTVFKNIKFLKKSRKKSIKKNKAFGSSYEEFAKNIVFTRSTQNNK